MKKSIKFFTVFLTFSLFFLIDNVSAKIAENTCNYVGNDENDKEITIVCEFYQNDSVTCTKSVNSNTEGLQNWGTIVGGGFSSKNWYVENKKCLPYLVWLDTNALFDRYQLYGADTIATAESIKNDRNAIDGYEATVIPNSDSTDESSEKDIVLEKLNGYNELLSDIGENYELADYCKYENGVYKVDFNNYSASICKNKMQQVYESIAEYDAYIAEQISAGVISSNDDVVKQYYQIRDDARASFDPSFDETFYDDSNSGENSGVNSSDEDKDYTTTARQCITCGGIENIPEQLPFFVRGLISTVQILVPVILIILGIADFIKSSMASDEKQMSEGPKRFVRRIIASVAIFMAIAIVKLAFSLIPDDSIMGCVPCFTTRKTSCGTVYTCDTTDDNS